MDYLIPYSVVGDWLATRTSGQPARIRLRYDEFLDLLRLFLWAVPVDEDWYFETYPAVRSVIAAREFRSASHHFTMHGYFERRLPSGGEIAHRKQPVPFSDLQMMINVVPERGHLSVDVSARRLHAILQRLLASCPSTKRGT